MKIKRELQYNEKSEKIESKVLNLIYDNGTITKIQDHEKLYESCVYWIGEDQQWEFRNLDSVYFESINKG